MLRLLVSSFGGVGSKCLVKGLLQTDDQKALSEAHTHLPQPPAAIRGTKVIYVFGDPYDALVSFFQRRTKRTASQGFNGIEGNGDPAWVVRHCRKLGGDCDR